MGSCVISSLSLRVCADILDAKNRMKKPINNNMFLNVLFDMLLSIDYDNIKQFVNIAFHSYLLNDGGNASGLIPFDLLGLLSI